MSATAQTFVRTSVTVGPLVRVALDERLRAAPARAIMSADIEIWNAGAAHASVIRFATVLRSDVSSTRSIPAAGAAAGAAFAGPETAARSTSSATIRPSGPVPASAARSMPRSRAIRRASGDALIRPPFPLAACSRGRRSRDAALGRAATSVSETSVSETRARGCRFSL